MLKRSSLALAGLGLAVVLGCAGLGGDAGEVADLRAKLDESEAQLAASKQAGAGPSATGAEPSATAASGRTADEGTPITMCSEIRFAPEHLRMFKVVSAEYGNGWSSNGCTLVVEALVPIDDVGITWRFFDEDGVRIGDRTTYLEDMRPGDRAKVGFTADIFTDSIESLSGD